MRSSLFSSENPFSGLSEEISTLDTNASPITSNGVATLTQVTLASMFWLMATNSTTAITQKGVRAGLKSVKPGMILDGMLPTFAYNFGPVEAAISAQKNVAGDGTSTFRKAASVLAGAATEAAIGNPLDLLSLKQMFHWLKIEGALQKNPKLLDGLNLEELRTLAPSAKHLTSEEALKRKIMEDHLSAVPHTRKNLALLSKATKIKLTLADAAKAIGVSAAPSIVRNMPFYYGLASLNEVGEKGENKFLDAALIGFFGSFATSIPNNAAYDAVALSIKGQAPVSALKDAMRTSVSQVFTDPKKFAVLGTIRFCATLTAMMIFSDSTKEEIRYSIDLASEKLVEALGFKKEDAKLSDEEKKCLDDVFQHTAKNEVLAADIVESLRKPGALDAQADKPNTTTSSPNSEKLASRNQTRKDRGKND